MQMLFVEDDETLAFVTKRALQKRGYEVHWFNKVAQAQNSLQEKRYECALLDLKIGNDTSLHLISHIRKTQGDVPIVVLTGYGSIATAVQAVKLGAINYLTKPCSVEKVVAALENCDPLAAAITPEALAAPSLRRLEWEAIQKALDENEGNISATARQLKMHRRTLQRKLQKRPSAQDT